MGLVRHAVARQSRNWLWYISRKLQICYSLKAEMRLKRVPYLRGNLDSAGRHARRFFFGAKVTHAPSPPVKRPFAGGVSLGRLPGALMGRTLMGRRITAALPVRGRLLSFL